MTRLEMTMPTGLERLTAREVTQPLSRIQVTELAGVTRAWRVRGVDHGVIYDPASATDVIALRVYANLVGFPAPFRARARNTSQEPELRYRKIAEYARTLVTDDRVTEHTVIWVKPTGDVETAFSLEGRAEIEKRLSGNQVTIRIPIGIWIVHDLPFALNNPDAWALQVQQWATS